MPSRRTSPQTAEQHQQNNRKEPNNNNNNNNNNNDIDKELPATKMSGMGWLRRVQRHNTKQQY